MENNNYLLRTARDLLVRQLGLASPAPLADLPVSAAEPVVLHGNNTFIAIAYRQPDVQYRLCDGEGHPISGAKGDAKGKDGTLLLKTNSLNDDDYSFGIRAVRTSPADDAHLPSIPEVKLLQTALVQVRIDTELDTSLKPPVIAFGARAEVRVLAAQSKTRYQLVNEKEERLGAAVATSASGDVQLWTDALTDDTTLVVQATNIKTGFSDLLTNRLQVKVEPNLTLAATLSPSVVDYNGKTEIHLADTQKEASYQLVIQEVGSPAPRIIEPAMDGTGGKITLPTDALHEDCIVSIKVTKQASGLTGMLAVQLPVPVRPDPAKELSLVKSLADNNAAVSGVLAGTSAFIKVANTQLGVCYQLRVGTSSVGTPGYHRTKAGIGEARVGIEFAVGEFAGDAVYLPTGVLTQPTTFSVFAYKPTRGSEGVEVVRTTSKGVEVSTISVTVQAGGA